MKKAFWYLLILLLVCVFFWQFFLKGLLPIPSDTIIGLYHPFRDLYAKDYPRGIPFKNFLITDSVRQQYPWRELAVTLEKKLQLPLWNPYSFAGTPLLANFQSATFYPFNILFFIMPFNLGWSLLIFLSPLLSGLFLFLYLDNLKLSRLASLLGAITFSFSGFSIAWLEWGTITHVGLWLPLILLAIDKLVSGIRYQVLGIRNRNIAVWSLVYLLALIFAFFAGHLQIFFYLFIFSWVYFLSRWLQCGKILNILFIFLIFNFLFLILTSIQWVPTFQLILSSARNVDLIDFNNLGWFIPWQNFIQFIAPDFFGNPTTLNYWGVWNYGEFVGYIGIVPLVLALFAMFFRRDRKTLFFGTFLFFSLIFAFPTIFAKIPYLLSIPFIATAQPTRLLFITDFTLAILSALGFDYLLKTRKKSIIYPLIFISIVLMGLWIFIPKEHLAVVKNNLILPTLLFIFCAILLLALLIVKKNNKFIFLISITIVAVATFDLFRFGWKFTPFTQKNYLFPATKTIEFLQRNLGDFRIMTTDARVLPPNFAVIYRLQSVDGYDPLYLRSYGELIAATERDKPDINPPFGFNRIIVPHGYDSKIIDLMGVKFILSLSDLNSKKLKKVFQEGQTRVYENANVLPRAFFVEKVLVTYDKYESINSMLDQDFDFRNSAIVENTQGGVSVPPVRLRSGSESHRGPLRWTRGEVKITSYSENRIVIGTKNAGDGFLVLTDSYYPTWHAKIDEIQTEIYRTDYNFRGLIVPAGKHTVEFYNSLF